MSRRRAQNGYLQMKGRSLMEYSVKRLICGVRCFIEAMRRTVRSRWVRCAACCDKLQYMTKYSFLAAAGELA